MIRIYNITTEDANRDDAITISGSTIPNWLTFNDYALVSTFSGIGAGYFDGDSSTARFYNPKSVAVDDLGNLYVADYNNHRIRKITIDGTVSTIAGGARGYLDANGVNARFNYPTGVDVDAYGSVYVADHGNQRIRKITPDGTVTTLAGSSLGFLDGTGAGARFAYPLDVAVAKDGFVYVSDRNNNRIRKISPIGVVTTLASVQSPNGLEVDSSGTIYVANYNGNKIEKVTSTGTVTTLAGQGPAQSLDGTGTSARFNRPLGLAIDNSGDIYVSEGNGHRIRKVTTAGVVTTVAGNSAGFLEGDDTTARFNLPYSIAAGKSGVLYVADDNNHRIRKIDVSKKLEGTPTITQTGNHNVSLQVSDGNGGTATQNFTINVADVTDPIISVISPLDDASNIAINTNLEITFSENIAKGTGNITIYDASDNSVVEAIDVTSGNVTINNTVVTINPTSDLAYNKSYYIQIVATAFKDTGNNNFAGILDTTTWSFSTLTGLPTLTTTDATAIGENTVTFGGEITNEGLASTVTERGILFSMYALDTDPEVGETHTTKIIVGSGLGVFTDTQTSLESNRKYAYRAYAVNSAGTIYGSLKTFITDAKTTDAFITKWKTTGTNQNVAFVANSIDVKVDWGDGSAIESFTGNFFHTYANAGEYDIAITGDFSSFIIHPVSRGYIESIEQWGNQKWKSFSQTFLGCSNLSTLNATDVPDLSLTTNFFRMFRETPFNGDIGNWDMSSAENLAEMFGSNSQFNQDISHWDVSNVTNFSNMFFGATSFNQSLGKWQFIDNSSTTLNITIPNISTANADATIIGWAKNEASRTNAINMTFPSKICKAVTSANTLVGLGWFLNGVTTDCTGLDINTFTATSDNNWSTVGNWSKGTLPTKTEDVEIPTGQTAVLDVTVANAKNLYVSGAINTNSNTLLYVDGLLQNDGTITFNDSKLYIKDNSIGNITYNKSGDTNWHLITSPVKGETIQDIIATGVLATGSGGNLGLAVYNNGLKPVSGWQYVNASSTGLINVGTGYSLKRASSGNITFIGEPITTGNTSIAISEGGTGINQNSWNLIGNPYTYPVSITEFFTLENMTNLNPSFVAVYKWNGTTYDIVNLSSSSNLDLNPGESFFVNSKSTNGLLKFQKPIPNITSSKSSTKKNITKPELKLFINNGTTAKSTEIKYLENATIGLDIGYDAGVFGGVSSSFDVYTHLVSNDNNNYFGIQCLPNKNIEDYAVPVGIQLKEEKEVTFSINANNFDSSTNIYLEDRKTNSFIKMNTDNDTYKIILNQNDNGTGRFYIHTTAKTLSTPNNFGLQNVHLFLADQQKLRITGLVSENSKLTLFTLLGKKVYNTTFNTQGTTEVAIPNLPAGIYLVNLVSEKGKMSKKIVIE